MSALEKAYTVTIQAVGAALPMLAGGKGKLARGVRGRRGLLTRISGWAQRGRDPARPLVWFHAASVGEGLQARAVLERFRDRRPDAQLVFTFFSPSAESLARRVPADFVDYLPLDVPGQVGAALDLLSPDVLAFSKYDVWLNLTHEAKRRGTRVVLLSGTLPENSSRLRFPTRTLLRRAYSRLDAVAAISGMDADRFDQLGVPAERRRVMGDARFDQVWERANQADRDSPLLAPLRDPERVTLVAGSTWPPDERRLLDACADCPPASLRLVLVPHEPTPERIAALATELRARGLSSLRFSELGGSRPATEVVLVDRVGILGELYAVADVAYVGGGWGRAGIHSVLEPAAYGLPVLFGHRHENAREAADLVACGGGFEAADERELACWLNPLVRRAEDRRRAGEAARRYVQANLGAADRGAALLEELLAREPRRSADR